MGYLQPAVQTILEGGLLELSGEIPAAAGLTVADLFVAKSSESGALDAVTVTMKSEKGSGQRPEPFC